MSIHRPHAERDAEAVRRAKALLEELPEGRRFTWAFRQRDLMSNLVRDGGLHYFLTWPIVSESLYAGYTYISEEERKHLPQELRELAVDFRTPPPPAPLSPEGASGTYIKQTALLAALAHGFLNPRGIENFSSVYEVGGGYGAMAVMLSRLGFRGTHTVLDLPALHVIRDWYLEGADVLVDTADWPGEQEVDVLFAVHSLCEMPVEDRLEILSNVRAEYYVFSITKSFDGIDNSKWFRYWCQDQELVYRDWWPWVSDSQDVIIAERK
jgi:hypothetical protein